MAGRTALPTIAVGTNPIALAVDCTNHNIYVANRLAGTVSVINSAGTVIDTVPVGSVPVAIGINGATNKIYVVNLNSYTVTVIDPPI
jgi:YVTN family beta-propeller protein